MSTPSNPEVQPQPQLQTYIHCFDLDDGERIGSFPLRQLPEVVSTAECKFCPCIQPRDVAEFFAAHPTGPKTFRYLRPSYGPASRFLGGTYSWLDGRLQCLFIIDDQPTRDRLRPFSALSPRIDAQLFAQIVTSDGTTWAPEPLFADGDPHHA